MNSGQYERLEDSESDGLISSSVSQREQTHQASVGSGDSNKPIIEWGKFGLEETQSSYQEQKIGQVTELFHEQESSTHKPWWKANFFIREPVLFGTWDGVFTSCMLNIFGVVIFIRTGWVVGNAGIGLSILIVALTIFVALISALSAIGVCERCLVDKGGVYFLVTHVLGARIGGTVGLLYSFGQTVACALYCTGFGESIIQTFNMENTWAVRGIGIATILLLLAINIAGVKWVIKMQLILLAILGIATLDFIIGTFSHTDEVNGFSGYSSFHLRNNSGPSYTDGENFFSVFGVFFPTATGVMAGVNMSGDLKTPSKSIPIGTMFAILITTVLYLVYVVLLGATVDREALQTDFVIGEKVALTGFLWLAGLYISSLSSCLSGLYQAPRVLQTIANENVIPFMKILGRGKGPNQEPIVASILVCAVGIAFIFVGHVNELGPIVTMPFLLTYATIDYCYFALAMSYDNKGTIDIVQKENNHLLGEKKENFDTNYGTTKEQDQNFVEDHQFTQDQKDFMPDLVEKKMDQDDSIEIPDQAKLLGNEDKESNQIQQEKFPADGTIRRMPNTWYSIICNRWLSLAGIPLCILMMFLIHWGYALAIISITLLVYIYIGQANPGVRPGIANFNFYIWIKSLFQRLCRKGNQVPEQRIVCQPDITVGTTTEQLTEENEDFAYRGRYHQSSVVQGANFDEFEGS